ncbi:MAG: PulJ/GspJ family protein [Egibacteraceae bacterium]
MLSSLRHRLGAEEGFSLIELLVVIVLMSVVGGMVTQGIVTGMRTTRKATARVEAVAELQRTLARTTREIRAACPVRASMPTPTDPTGTVTADRLVVDIERAGEDWRYFYTLDSVTGDLLERRDRYDAGTATWVTELGPRAVITDVANTDLFTYYDKAFAATSNPRAVHRIEVRVDRDLPEQDPIEVSTLVAVRNAERCPF